MKKNNLISQMLLIVGYLSIIAGIATIAPWPAAKEANILGYKSLCSFTPVSTAICLILSNTAFTVRKKKFLF